jgi:D-serine deaminase-like pyridoxal phosphate-dependent protein
VGELPTPALIVDAVALEHNLKIMAGFFDGRAVRLRPHCKTHKCFELASRQLAAGAAGLAVATISEAYRFAGAGFPSLLVTSPLVGSRRIAAAARLAREAPGLVLVADQQENVADIDAAAGAEDVQLGVMVDLDCGSARTGTACGPAAVSLALDIARRPRLRFEGFQAFASHAMHVTGYEERRRAVITALEPVVETRRRAELAGLEVRAVSVGGTGSYEFDVTVPGVTDVQAGSYVFMDAMYRRIGDSCGPVFQTFAPALFIMTTVISRTAKNRLTVDAGYKASATDHDCPQPWDVGDVSYEWAGDEHGILTLRDPARDLRVGDRVRLLVGHCDPTVNLHDRLYVCRDDEVVAEWPVAARGYLH